MATTTPKRGRPAVYTGAVESYIVGLLKKHNNATKVRNILNAPKPKKGRQGSAEFQERDLKIVPKPLGISPPTIGKLAKRHKIKLPKGRPAKAA